MNTPWWTTHSEDTRAALGLLTAEHLAGTGRMSRADVAALWDEQDSPGVRRGMLVLALLLAEALASARQVSTDDALFVLGGNLDLAVFEQPESQAEAGQTDPEADKPEP